MIPYRRLAPAAVLALLALAPAARASDPLVCALAPAANDAARWLKGHRQAAVAVGAIAGPATFPATAAPGIRLVLTAELKKREIEVKERAGYGLRVTYKAVELADARDPSRTRLVVDFGYTFEDAKGMPVDEFTARVENEEAVCIILGLSQYRGSRIDRAADRAAVAAFYTPQPTHQGSAVIPGAGCPYKVELLVNDKAVAPVARDGLSYAPVGRDAEYAIKLTNDADHEVAARVLVDGINVFHFSDLRQPKANGDGTENRRAGEPLYELVLIPARGSVVVTGWHKTNERVLGFKVTEYAETAAAKLGRADAPVGTVTVTFAAAWETTPPADEPPLTRGAGDDGTGFGRPRAADVRPVVRTIGAVRATASVRYALPKN